MVLIWMGDKELIAILSCNKVRLDVIFLSRPYRGGIFYQGSWIVLSTHFLFGI